MRRVLSSTLFSALISPVIAADSPRTASPPQDADAIRPFVDGDGVTGLCCIDGFADEHASYDRPGGCAKQVKESIQASGKASLILGYFVCDNGAPGGIGEVIGELQ